jgi:hypothetical protein
VEHPVLLQIQYLLNAVHSLVMDQQQPARAEVIQEVMSLHRPRMTRLWFQERPYRILHIPSCLALQMLVLIVQQSAHVNDGKFASLPQFFPAANPQSSLSTRLPVVRHSVVLSGRYLRLQMKTALRTVN